MGILVHMNDVHPEVVAGEPIPEIEPRVDRELLELMSIANRRGRWFWVGTVGMALFFVYFHFRMWIAFTSGIILLTLWGYSMRRLRSCWRGKRMAGEIGNWLSWSVPIRINIEYMFYTVSVLMIFFVLTSAQEGASGLFRNLGLILLFGGGASVYLGRVARQPGQICCRWCEYPLVGLGLPNPCPECGKELLDGYSTTDRPRVRSRWFLWGGLVSAIFGLMVMYASIYRPGFMYGPVPRGVLLRMASTDRSAFDRLMLTPMTVDEEQRLIDAMVANHTTDSYKSSFAQGQWISQQILGGRLSEAQLESVFHKTTEIVIDAPSSAKVGAPIELRLKADYVRLPSFGVTPGYYFRGFVVDDESAAQGGDSQPHFRLYLTQSEYRAKSDVPKHTWTPLTAGTHTIHARVVLALFPGGGKATNVPIDWSKPADSMFGMTPIWSHVVDLEKTIEVEP
jgi:hypothetical protein